MKSLFFNDNSGEAFSSLLNFSHYKDFDNGVIEGRDGTWMAAYSYTGIDIDSASDTQLNFMVDRINRSLVALGNGWALNTDAVRFPIKQYPDGDTCHFPDAVSQSIDDERRAASATDSAAYQTVLWFVLSYKVPSKAARRVADAVVNDESDSSGVSSEEKAFAYFNRTRHYIENNFRALFKQLIHATPYFSEGSYYCDFLRYLNYCATGINRSVRIPSINYPLSKLIAGQDFFPMFSPRVGQMNITVLTIEGLPDSCVPGQLSFLEHLPLSYRWSTRFIFMDSMDSLGKLDSKYKQWKQKVVSFRDKMLATPNPQIDEDAASMAVDAQSFMNEIKSGDVGAGFYTGCVVIYTRVGEDNEEHVESIQQLISQCGMGARIETINATEAFLGTIPGNVYPNLTRPIVTTANLADLMPVSSQWPGEEFCPCPHYPAESPCLIQAETEGSTPFRVNLHHGEKGHTFIAGPTDSGKSTLVALIAAQFMRYKNAQVFNFDKGHSMYPLTKGVGGRHFDIGSEQPVTLIPLSELDTATDRAWAGEWVESCLTLSGMDVSAGQRNSITAALKLMSEAPKDSRTITEFVSNVQDMDIREAMEFYTFDGGAGHLLDADVESVEFGNFNTIETEDLMGMGDRVVLPVLSYLFNRIKRSLDGSPTLIILDECWLLFKHPLFREMIIEWLKVLRKANAAVVLATQSLNDAASNDVMDVINESCDTKILLPHHTVAMPTHRDFYAGALGLNDREIDLLVHGTPKREYYFTNSYGNRMFNLNLKPSTLAWVGRTGKEDLQIIRDLQNEYPETWRSEWVSHCTAA